MRRITIAVMCLVLGLGITATACGGDGPDAVPVRTDEIPTAPDRVLLRIDTRGGFTSADYQLAIVPQLTIFGDGQVIVTGPVTEQYPPHALPNLRTGTLDRAAVERLAARAGELDLLRPQDFGQPGVSDLPTTEVTLDVAPCAAGPAADCATPRPLRADALDFDIGGESPGVTATQSDARRRLSTFVREASDAAARVATDPYVASQVAVYSRPAEVEDFAPTGCCPGVIDWPLGDLATLGAPVDPDVGFRCTVLSGADAATALAAAVPASTSTRWRSAAGIFSVVFRPLMPDEPTCP